MKSAELFSADQRLGPQIEALAISAGGQVHPGKYAQVRDAEGRLFSVDLDWSYVDEDEFYGVPSLRGSGTPPDRESAAIVYVECRWEGVFIDWMHRIQRELDEPLWILDSDNVFWLAAELNPDELVL